MASGTRSVSGIGGAEAHGNVLVSLSRTTKIRVALTHTYEPITGAAATAHQQQGDDPWIY